MEHFTPVFLFKLTHITTSKLIHCLISNFYIRDALHFRFTDSFLRIQMQNLIGVQVMLNVIPKKKSVASKFNVTQATFENGRENTDNTEMY